MLLRALIWGLQEYEETPCDYKGDILLAQQEIAREDAISFVTPDNINVHVETVNSKTTESIVSYLISKPLRDFITMSTDTQVQTHWALLQYHYDQLEKLRTNEH